MTERETIAALPVGLRTPYKASLVRDRVAAFGLAKGTRITRGPYVIEFDDTPRIIANRAGVGVAIDAMVRVFRVRDGVELRIDPHRIFVNPPIMVPDGTVRTVTRMLHGREIQYEVFNFREDPVEAYVQSIIESIERKPAAKGFRTRGTVSTFFANSDDGWIDSSNGTFSTAAAGGGSFYVGATSEDLAIGNTTSAGVYFLDEGWVRFDTSSIPDSDTIDDVDLTFLRNDSSFLWAVGDLQARTGYTYSGGGVSDVDWRTPTQLSALTLVASIASGSISGFFTLTENGTSFRSAINKTGFTEITLCFSTLAANTPPTDLGYCILARAETTGTSQDPTLVVTHTGVAGFNHHGRPYGHAGFNQMRQLLAR